ncbi:uncharacterized protein LOC130636907 [Hydractinia symbiolongicarpus]|uniref:uncharacterized protein LOC130636907 n=1 Tax=Hydractinia symbiolongicarpus TaxID=13093 RepID=UPI00254F80E1|nr:uncharacterized protein LOC130636907 [Hydractinia symbiolongicarpus]
MVCEQEDVILILTLSLAVKVKTSQCKKKKQRKRFWVRPWLLDRQTKGACNSILSELRLQDTEHFRYYLRMNTETFVELLEKVRPYITKQTTSCRKPISAEEKLSVTLRFLATGESYQSLMYQFRMSDKTISLFVPIVARAIYRVLKKDYLRLPQTEEEWKALSDKINLKWRFPNCIGALDGKHIPIKLMPNTGSTFYSYKGFHNAGCQGRISDGGVLRNRELYHLLNNHRLALPPPKQLPLSEDPAWDQLDLPEIPYVIVGDDAFALSKNLLKPFSKNTLCDAERIFNYRLSRFRKISENAFGILSARFRIINSTINLSPSKTTSLVMAIVALHNMLMTKSKDSYAPVGLVDQEDLLTNRIVPGQWRGMADVSNDLQTCAQRKASSNAKEIRCVFKDYFMGSGQVSWQWNMLV